MIHFNLFRRWPKLADTDANEFQRLEREAEPYQPGMVFETSDPISEKTE